MSPERKVCAPASLPSGEVRRRNNIEDLYTVAYMARLRACWRVALRIRRSFSRTLMRNRCQCASQMRGLWRKTTYVPERNRKTMLHATTRLCKCSEPKAKPFPGRRSHFSLTPAHGETEPWRHRRPRFERP